MIPDTPENSKPANTTRIVIKKNVSRKFLLYNKSIVTIFAKPSFTPGTATITGITNSTFARDKAGLIVADELILVQVADFAGVFGTDRRIAICRELTKAHEEVLRMTLGEAIAHYAATDPRGEYVLVVAGADEVDMCEDVFWKSLDIPAHVHYHMEQGLSKMDAIKQTAKDRGIPKNDVYKLMIEE